MLGARLNGLARFGWKSHAEHNALGFKRIINVCPQLRTQDLCEKKAPKATFNNRRFHEVLAATLFPLDHDVTVVIRS